MGSIAMPERVEYNFKQVFETKVAGPEGTMRALRFHGKKDIRLDQIPIPVTGKGQVKVKPAFVGICGTGKLFALPGMAEECVLRDEQIFTNTSEAQA